MFSIWLEYVLVFSPSCLKFGAYPTPNKSGKGLDGFWPRSLHNSQLHVASPQHFLRHKGLNYLEKALFFKKKTTEFKKKHAYDALVIKNEGWI